MSDKMAKKRKAQKKDKHENRNAVIVGSLLALLPIVIFLLYDQGLSPCDLGLIKPGYEGCPPPGTPSWEIEMYECRMGSYGCPSFMELIQYLPFLSSVYITAGALLYPASIISGKFNKDSPFSGILRFWGKSFLVGGILGTAVTPFIIPLLLELFL